MSGFEYELLPRARSIWAVFAEPRSVDVVIAEIFRTPPRARSVVESRHSPVLTHEFIADAFGALYLVVAVVIDQPVAGSELWQIHAVYPTLGEPKP